jgi:hypothetical protein
MILFEGCEEAVLVLTTANRIVQWLKWALLQF